MKARLNLVELEMFQAVSEKFGFSEVSVAAFFLLVTGESGTVLTVVSDGPLAGLARSESREMVPSFSREREISPLERRMSPTSRRFSCWRKEASFT